MSEFRVVLGRGVDRKFIGGGSNEDFPTKYNRHIRYSFKKGRTSASVFPTRSKTL